MMREKRVVVVSDSTSSLSPAVGQAHGIRIVPIYVHFGTQTYRDGVDLDADQFYQMLRRSQQLPTTAQPTAMDFVQAYTQLWEQGQVEAIVSIHPSIKMSATADAARAARRELADLPIHVIDSGTISMGLGMIAMAAAHAAQAGKGIDEVMRLLEGLMPQVRVVFTVETLEYLYKGGRIGGATALFGSLLNIKPLLYLAHGRVEPLAKPRTRKRAIESMLSWVAEQMGDASSIHAAVLHCNAIDDAQEVAAQVRQRFRCAELLMAETGPTIGVHGGPGTVGIVCYPSEALPEEDRVL
jgi:DegV family protein with EDD domain